MGYSDTGVRALFGSLKVSPKVTFDRQALETYPTKYKGKMSISGYQPKMSAKVVQDALVLIKEKGSYIIKPSPAEFPHLAENEHAVMTLARLCKFATSPFGLIQLDNGELAFIIKRYDRIGESKRHQEQLDSAMGIDDKFGRINGERTVSYAQAGIFIAKHLKAVQQYADFYKRVIFSYVVGNNDHHLRNFSLLFKPETGLPLLSPVYDLISVAPYDEVFRSDYLALPLLLTEEHESQSDIEVGFDRKYGQYDRLDFIRFGQEIGLKRPAAIKLLDTLLKDIEKALPYLKRSFVPETDKKIIEELINSRLCILRDNDPSL